MDLVLMECCYGKLMLSFHKTLKIILGLKKSPHWNPGVEWISTVKA